MKRINLWSSPRNVSTALMYSFAQRPDTRVVDEPLYGYYLHLDKTNLQHPAKAEILQHLETDGAKVVREVLLGDYDKPVVVFKQMTHHLQALDRSFMVDMDHVLLIRDPRRIIHSFEKVLPNPTLDDIGVGLQWELFQYLRKAGWLVAVLDARYLLLDPEQVLRKLCAQLSIPFFPEMLHWEAGPRPEDGIWAPYWYAAVHRSTGFQPYEERELNLSAQAEALAARCMPYYERLLQHAIQP